MNSLLPPVPVKLLSCVLLFMIPWTVANQAPPSIQLSRQQYWSGLPFPSPGDIPDPGIEPRSPPLQADTLPSELPRKPTATATAAKSLQSCPTLCDPIDFSPPGSTVLGILQVRTLEWVAISFSNAWMWKGKVKSLSRVWLLATLWPAAYQVPPSMGFSRQEYLSGVPLSSPRKPTFRRKLKKVGKTIRPFRYDLNQIPYDYTVEVTNRFKRLDLIECLKNYGWKFMALYRKQWSKPPQGKEMQKGQMVVWGGLTHNRKEEKWKKKKKGDICIWKQSSKEEQGKIKKQQQQKKTSSVINTKKQRKTIEWERLEISSRKLCISREYFMQRWTQWRIEMVCT